MRSEDVARATRLTGMRVTRLPKTAAFAALMIDFKMEEGIRYGSWTTLFVSMSFVPFWPTLLLSEIYALRG